MGTKWASKREREEEDALVVVGGVVVGEFPLPLSLWS